MDRNKKAIDINMNRVFWGIVFSLIPVAFCSAQTNALKPFGPVPSSNQLRVQQMESYAFVHFSLNTYTDQSWGFGNEDVNLFNPKDLDCRQWARICKEAGSVVPVERNSLPLDAIWVR